MQKARSVTAKPRKPRRDAKREVLPPDPIFPVLGRWIDEPQPVLRLELIRIFAPLATLGFMSSRLAHVTEWIGDSGFHVPDLGKDDWRQPLYLPPLPSWAAMGFGVLMVASGLALSAGFRARRAALVFAVTLAFVALADRLSAFTVTKLSPAVMLALAMSQCGERYGIDALLRRRREPEVAPKEEIPGGSIRFFQLLLVAMYSASGIAKLRGDWLKNPVVLWTQIHDSYQTVLAYWLANATPTFVWTALQIIVVTLATLAPLWFAIPRTRTPAFVMAVGMHVMIGLMFWPVRWFALLMITILVGGYLPDAAIAWLSRLFSRAAPSPPALEE